MTQKQSSPQEPARAPASPRSFDVPVLANEDGCVAFEVGGSHVVAVEVRRGVATFDSMETLQAVLDGRLHPVVAALQCRVMPRAGDDRRFVLQVLLGLRASSPAFAKARV